MSQHYAVSLFDSPIANAQIISVDEPANLQTLLNGAFIIRVPDGVQVENPVNVTDLLNQKYQSLLADNPSLTYVTYDDLLDATHVDPTSGPGIFGQRGTMCIAPGGTFSSVINSGAGNPLSGAAPDQAMLTWEVFTVTTTDPSAGQVQRTYTELASTPEYVTATMSFNGGLSYNATTDSTIANILEVDQGTAFIVEFTNVSQQRLYLGSWALLY